jgi:protein-S-isoprenylcysteine O-methyltransferase Ste14
MDAKLLMRYALRETLGLLGMAVALFWAAGRLGWWQAWLALALMLAWMVALAVIFVWVTPALLAERLLNRPDAKSWDVAILSAVSSIQLARYIIAGLDQRYGWTGGFRVDVQFMAVAVCIVGHSLFIWAAATNAFFSRLVRVQSERHHAVVTAGPYRYLRHPGYLGAILFELAVPVLLTSWWSLGISALGVGLLILRTVLEERTLLVELPGYIDYVRRVRYRLLPGVW